MSIASEIQRLQTAKTNIKTSIENKGVTVPSSALLDTYSTYIDQISGGGEVLQDVWEGVNFLDYDGTTVEVWKSTEVASKTSLPDYPTHDGLTYSGWNWTLQALKDYIADFPDACIYVGPEVYSTDGYTHIFIRLDNGALEPYLNFQYTGTTTSIDWGDNDTTSLPSTSSAVWTLTSQQHKYEQPGEYEIKIKNADNLRFYGAGAPNYYSLFSAIQFLGTETSYSNSNNKYQNSILGIWFQSNISTRIMTYSLRNARNLQFIASPKINSPGDYFAISAILTKFACFPKSGYGLTYNNYGMQNVAIPYDATINGSMFNNNHSLRVLSIPKTTTSLPASMCAACYSLRKITIPNTVTTLGSQCFANCQSLENVVIPSSTTTISNGNNFQNNYLIYYC